jgi:flagellar basal body-associated protein FliL
MFRILLILTVVILVAGGGAAGWWFGLRGEPFPFASAQASEGDATGMPASATSFVELDPMTFPVMRDGQVRELVTYVVQLEVPDDAAEARLKAREPAVRDAMLSELHGLYAYSFIHEREDKLALVKQRLLNAVRRATDAPVRSVLLKGLDRRPQQARRP